MRYLLIILCLVLSSCSDHRPIEEYIYGEGWMSMQEEWKEVDGFFVDNIHYTEFHLKKSDSTEIRMFKRDKLQTIIVPKEEIINLKKNKK
jgi:hypothetical protein